MPSRASEKGENGTENFDSAEVRQNRSVVRALSWHLVQCVQIAALQPSPYVISYRSLQLYTRKIEVISLLCFVQWCVNLGLRAVCCF